MRKIHISRRELLLACPTLALFPTIVHATIPPPPSSPWYLIFIADGIYRISGLYIVDLPASFGTARNYDKIDVSQAVRAQFTFTGPHGVSPWQMLIGSPSYEWFEAYDRRNGRIFRLWKYDRFEVRFSDKSRVKVRFNGLDTTPLFWPLAGTERRPDGQPMRDGSHEGRERGDRGSGPVSVTPGIATFSWSYSTQTTPW